MTLNKLTEPTLLNSTIQHTRHISLNACKTPHEPHLLYPCHPYAPKHVLAELEGHLCKIVYSILGFPLESMQQTNPYLFITRYASHPFSISKDLQSPPFWESPTRMKTIVASDFTLPSFCFNVCFADSLPMLHI